MFPPLYSQNPMNENVVKLQFFFQTLPCPGQEAAALIRSTRVLFMQRLSSIKLRNKFIQMKEFKKTHGRWWGGGGGLLLKWCSCYLRESSRVPSGLREASLLLFHLTDLWI